VDWLWDYWTAPGFTDEEHLAEVKRMLAGWERHVFEGLKPGDVFPGQTSVWRRPGGPPADPGVLA